MTRFLSRNTAIMLLALFWSIIHPIWVSAAEAWRFPLVPSVLAPTVQYEGRQAQLGLPTVLNDKIRWPLRENGREIGELEAKSVSDSRLELTLSASRAGRFQFTLWVNVRMARPLDVKSTRVTDGFRTFFYPYNWEVASPIGARRERDGQDVANVAPIDLVSPGFESEGRYFSVDTWRLTKLVFRALGGRTSVGIVKSIEVNDGFDTTTPDLALMAGGQATIALVSAPSIAGLSALRFGTPRPTSGRLTFLYNKRWPCPEVQCAISQAGYETFAEHLKGAFDLVILRSFTPSAKTADTFRHNGIAPFYYMFLGAERRSTGSSFTHDEWVLKDVNDRQYGAPIVSPTSSWGLMDIRRDDVRAALVARATSVLALGYKGVFFDGPAFWLGSDGHVGGRAIGATMSWTYARAKLLQETRTALSAIDPDSRVGILGDRFYDAQGLADFSMKESYGENWISIDPNPDARSLRNSPKINRAWDRTYRHYTTNNLFIGQKGSNPLLIGAGLQWAKTPAGTWFTEIGDAYKIDGGFDISLDRMGRILRATSVYAVPPQGAALTSMDPPNAEILTYGPSIIGSKDAAVLNLDRPTPVFNLTTKAVSVSATVPMAPLVPVIIAERRGDWCWSGYGFAYRDASAYVYGDALFNKAPTGSSRDAIVFDVATSPGPMSKKALPLTQELMRPRTIVFHLPAPRGVTIAGVDHAELALPVRTRSAEEFEITLPEKPAFGDFVVKLHYKSAVNTETPSRSVQ